MLSKFLKSHVRKFSGLEYFNILIEYYQLTIVNSMDGTTILIFSFAVADVEMRTQVMVSI